MKVSGHVGSSHDLQANLFHHLTDTILFSACTAGIIPKHNMLRLEGPFWPSTHSHDTVRSVLRSSRTRSRSSSASVAKGKDQILNWTHVCDCGGFWDTWRRPTETRVEHESPCPPGNGSQDLLVVRPHHLNREGESIERIEVHLCRRIGRLYKLAAATPLGLDLMILITCPSRNI